MPIAWLFSRTWVLDQDLKIRLSKMARFWNLLVHLYWQVDDREVFRVSSWGILIDI
jgi:uncharacterized protein YutE (UPF0331/DUF86 family)